MPASKKDLRKLQQKKNVENGIGDKDGKIPSQVKVKIIVYRIYSALPSTSTCSNKTYTNLWRTLTIYSLIIFTEDFTIFFLKETWP